MVIRKPFIVHYLKNTDENSISTYDERESLKKQLQKEIDEIIAEYASYFEGSTLDFCARVMDYQLEDLIFRRGQCREMHYTLEGKSSSFGGVLDSPKTLIRCTLGY